MVVVDCGGPVFGWWTQCIEKRAVSIPWFYCTVQCSSLQYMKTFLIRPVYARDFFLIVLSYQVTFSSLPAHQEHIRDKISSRDQLKHLINCVKTEIQIANRVSESHSSPAPEHNRVGSSCPGLSAAYPSARICWGPSRIAVSRYQI